MTVVRNAAGSIVSLSYSDVLQLYRGGTGIAQQFDMQAFMNSSASSFVRPTSFAAFEEVSNYVRQSGQAITFDQYYTNQGAQLGLNGAALDRYIKENTSSAFQRYFDGDFSTEGLFNKFVWGSTSYKIVGEIAPDGNGGTVFNGELRAFNDKFRFQGENKDVPLAILTGLLGLWSDPFFQGNPFDMNFAGQGRQYSNYDFIQANLDKVFTDNYAAQVAANRAQVSVFTPGPYLLQLADGLASLVVNIALDDQVFALASAPVSAALLMNVVIQAGAKKLVGLSELDIGLISVASASPSGLTIAGPWLNEHHWSNIQFNVDGSAQIESSSGAIIALPSGVGYVTKDSGGAPILVIPGVNDGSNREISFDQATTVVRIVAAGQAMEFAPDSQVTVDSDSRIAVTEFWNNEVKTSTQLNADLSGIVETYDLENQQFWSRKIAGTDADGLSKFNIEVEDDGSLGETRINGVVVGAAQIGSILGSNLGHVLGGNSLAGQVAASTLIGAIGRQVGLSLSTGWLSTDLTWIDPVTGASGMSSATGLAIEGMDTRIEAGFGQLLAGQLSSLLIGELAEALDLDGFEGGLFQTVGTTVTSQLMTNVYNVAVLGTNQQGVAYTLVDGFNAGSLITSITSAVGGYLGSQLAAQVMVPQGQTASVAASIGSSIGALLGSVFVPIPGIGAVIGTTIGSFVGNLLGQLVVHLFNGNDTPHSTAWVHYNTQARAYQINDISVDHGGDPAIFHSVGNLQGSVINALIGMTGGWLLQGPALTYAQDGNAYSLIDGGSYLYTAYATQYGTNVSPMAELGLMQLIRGIDIQGGDILFRRAWEQA